MNLQTREFLSLLWDGGNYGYYWFDFKTQWIKIGEGIKAWNLPELPTINNLWFGVNTCREIPQENAKGEHAPPEAVKGRIDYIDRLNCLYAEYDKKDFGGTKETRSHILSLPYQPSIITFSGGGYHCYWLLSEAFVITSEETKVKAQEIQYNWVTWNGADESTKDLARVLRVPGTYNNKEKYAPNFPLVKILRFDDTRYDYKELAGASKPPPPKKKPKPIQESGWASSVTERVLTTAIKMIAHAPEGEKHSTLLKAARLLGGYIGQGLDYTTAQNVLNQCIEHRADVKNIKGAYRTIEEGLRYGQSAPIITPTAQDKYKEWSQRNVR